MRVAAALFLILPLLACSGPKDTDRESLERIYIRLVEAGSPGREPAVDDLEALRATLDSLGGRARVESLLTASMENEPGRWKDLLDSLASSNP
ncbi:MAG: hypothetical protein JW958_10960 [Candidatus Eisenbacteria bacterium]|nr:hypothetical protein [Candidatus Eisenbacteria bacterium]